MECMRLIRKGVSLLLYERERERCAKGGKTGARRGISARYEARGEGGREGQESNLAATD